MDASSDRPVLSSPSSPRVLLVYANPAQTPEPVPPYGMARIAAAFRAAGCVVTECSPFLEDAPLTALRTALEEGVTLVGFSVRNLDDALSVRSELGPGAIDTTDLLAAVRPLVTEAVAAVGTARVLLGGAGVTAGGEAVIAALGARWGIIGPADDLAVRIGRTLVAGLAPLPVVDPRMADAGSPTTRARGFAGAYRPPQRPTPREARWLSLVEARQSAVPVEVSVGCNRRCWFCVEARIAGQQVIPRPVPAVVAEVDALIEAGASRIWLASSELNVPDERHAIALLRALKGRGVDLSFFLQAAPLSDALLDAAEECGVDPADIAIEAGHLDGTILRAGGGPANRSQLDALVKRWRRRGYRRLSLSVIFGAHPLETEATLARALETARQLDGLFEEGLSLSYSCGARVYPRSPLADWIRSHRVQAAPHLYGADDSDFVQPVVFCAPLPPRRMLARVRGALHGLTGDSGPLNTELAWVGDAEAGINRSLWRAAGGDRAGALAGLDAVLGEDPGHLAALGQKARLHHSSGQRTEARQALRRLLSLLPEGDPRRAEISAALQRW